MVRSYGESRLSAPTPSLNGCAPAEASRTRPSTRAASSSRAASSARAASVTPAHAGVRSSSCEAGSSILKRRSSSSKASSSPARGTSSSVSGSSSITSSSIPTVYGGAASNAARRPCAVGSLTLNVCPEPDEDRTSTVIRLLPLPGVFQPHSDSWLLARCLEQEPIGPGTAVLDLCTGSGLLAVIAATRGASVVAIDTSTSAVLSARLNATLNGVALQAVRGDMFSPLDGRRFDLIASNPPYLPSQTGALPSRGMSRAWEGGARGREF